MLRRRWRFFVVVAVLGALLGACVWLLLPTRYQASTDVLLQGTRTSDELVTETQVAMSSVVLDRTAAALGWHPTRGELQRQATAALGDGNVLTIKGTADSPERAQQLTDQVAREYVSYATELANYTTDASARMFREQREALRQEVTKVNDRITELQAATERGAAPESPRIRAELQDLRTALTQAMTKLDEANSGAGPANVVIMGQAERPSHRAGLSLLELAAGGALLAFVLGVFGHLASARADRRLRVESDIAAALGSPVLATVDVPEASPGDDRATAESTDQPAGQQRWKPLGKRLLLGREPWYEVPLPIAGDEPSRDIRYRRALARLRDAEAGPPTSLVLVPDDNAAAHSAADRLARLAEADGRYPALTVAEVAAARPTVPDGAGTVLVVLSLGTRTAWELVGVVEACADAGRQIVGAVVAYRTRPAGRPADTIGAPPGDVLAGSS
ncbi:MAG TPA: exopolysaccharide biosynthesis protein [Pseudonocardiaceae bacterium]|nr:exopolysaccharide biosynthesis protein [Pseudonocardiaceae bacterium]